ncbi:MAG: helix-turn-helix transcriptional regulator [Sphaerochaeta sp.]|jgi:DNA-binding CsgD family transcriptional regulator|nr:helix-turn-helix transcriptional regulator [Sphaerochaeta sp.]
MTKNTLNDDPSAVEAIQAKIKERYPEWEGQLSVQEMRDILNDYIALDNPLKWRCDVYGNTASYTLTDKQGEEAGRVIITSQGQLQKVPTAYYKGLVWSYKYYKDLDNVHPDFVERDAPFFSACRQLEWELKIRDIERLLILRKNQIAENTGAATEAQAFPLAEVGAPAGDGASIEGQRAAAMGEGGAVGKVATSKLTIRQKEVAVLLGCTVLPEKDLAAKLSISHNTFKKHRTNIFIKLDISRRQELVTWCNANIQEGEKRAILQGLTLWGDD